MDHYDPATVFSSIDSHGRYAYANQPRIAQWNLARFVETLLPLIDADRTRAIARATDVVNTFPEKYEQHWLTGMKLFQSVDSLYDLIYSGVLERFPKLKLVLVENELGWIPFVLEQWDYYFKRHGAKREGLAIKKTPSEYFHNQIYTTFFNDAVGGHILSWWGENNCMTDCRLPNRMQFNATVVRPQA